MTYGEMKDYVLQLLDRYSVAGEEVALSYNNQADAVARIPALARDGLYYVTTTVRRLRAVAELAEPETFGGWLVYDLPDDFYQLAGGLLHLENGHVRRFRGYRVVGGRQIWVPRSVGGQLLVEYFRYPAVPTGQPEDGAALDCPPEAQAAVAYYIAAHLAMEDNDNLYAVLYNEFERKLMRLQEGQHLECGVTEDVYA